VRDRRNRSIGLERLEALRAERGHGGSSRAHCRQLPVELLHCRARGLIRAAAAVREREDRERQSDPSEHDTIVSGLLVS
jgi:hypothetical protein